MPASARTLLVVLAAFLVWAYAGPSQLGGPLTLVITHGSSMEPDLSAGDLAVVRRTTHVQAGDVVLYRSRETGLAVLHRVIEASPTELTTKGDNNEWVDDERPARDQVRGVLWARLPGAGRWLTELRSPLASAVLGGVFFGTLGMALTPVSEARRKPLHRHVHLGGRLSLRATAFAQTVGADVLMGALVALLAAAVVLGAWAFSTSATSMGTTTIPYTHVADWSYRAKATAPVDGATGDQPRPMASGETSTGQPIFPSLTPVIEHSLSYRLSAPDVTDVTGRARMFVVLREDSTGWSRTFELVPWTDFTGAKVTLTADVDLPAAMQAIRTFGEVAGIPSGLYRAILAAEVDVNGMATQGQNVHDVFRPYVVFRIDPPRVVRVEQVSGGPSADTLAAGADPVATLFHQSATRAIPTPERFARSVPFLAWTFSVATLRMLALTVGLLACGGAMALYVTRRRANRRGAWFLIRARFGHRLAFTPVPPLDLERRRYVDVNDFDDILALADARVQPILCVEAEDHVDFYVMDEPNAIYRYRLLKAMPSESADAPTG